MFLLINILWISLNSLCIWWLMDACDTSLCHQWKNKVWLARKDQQGMQALQYCVGKKQMPTRVFVFFFLWFEQKFVYLTLLHQWMGSFCQEGDLETQVGLLGQDMALWLKLLKVLYVSTPRNWWCVLLFRDFFAREREESRIKPVFIWKEIRVRSIS